MTGGQLNPGEPAAASVSPAFVWLSIDIEDPIDTTALFPTPTGRRRAQWRPLMLWNWDIRVRHPATVEGNGKG
jgi:hypothetical protein